jgi:predicted nuclease of predicted toxin-antitoxin system
LNLLADESVDKQIVERLRADGHIIQFVAEFDPGLEDEAVLLKSRQSNAILLTADKDFGELVFRQRLLHSGVLLVRLAGRRPDEKAELVSRVLAEHSRELYRAFAVLSPRALRIRNIW